MTGAPFTAWGTLPGAPLAPWEGTEWPVDDTSVFVRSAGAPDGAPAVFVHGLGGASTNWTDLMALLGDRLHAHAPDLPGFGRSAPPANGRYPLAVHVRAIEGLVESLGAGPVHLFGNSLGGAVSTVLAARRPELVKTLTLISPALPDLRPRRGRDWRLPVMFLPGVGPRVAARLARRTPQEQATATLELAYHDVARVAPERMREAVEENLRRSTLAHDGPAFLASLRGLVAAQLRPGTGSLWAAAARVAAPTLLVWGRHDRLVDVALSDRAAATFPRNTLLIVEDAGHVAQLEVPERVSAAWREYFAA